MWDLAPQPGIELRASALGAQNPNHWTTSEVPSTLLKRKFKTSALENLVMCGASILFLLVLSKLLSQVGIKIAGRNVNNLKYADDTTLMAESEEELKGLLMKVKEESENIGLKLNNQKTKIMASGPITSWQIDGETVETVTDFSFLAPKITADGDCSHEIKRRLLLGRKVMINLDSILKNRDITLPTNVRLVKAMVSPWSCMDVRVGL